MTKTDYTALDTAIISAIGNAKLLDFSAICGHVNLHTKAIAEAANVGRKLHDYVEDWRIVDRRLQVLRKAGRIKYGRRTKKSPGGWVLA